MHPILFKIGSYEVHSYFVLMYLGFLASVGMAKRSAPYFRIVNAASGSSMISGPQLSEAAWAALFCFVLGGRLGFVVQHLSEFLADPLETIRLWHGGFSLFGGSVGAALYIRRYCQRKGLAAVEFVDIAAPGIALGAAIARLGCLLGGCCYGAPCELPWAMRFLRHDTPNIWTPPSHPTQLYEMAADLFLLGVLFVFRPFVRRQGEIGTAGLLLYALVRLILEAFRKGVTSPILAFGLTGTQCSCLLVFPITLGILFRLHCGGRNTLPGSLSAQR